MKANTDINNDDIVSVSPSSPANILCGAGQRSFEDACYAQSPQSAPQSEVVVAAWGSVFAGAADVPSSVTNPSSTILSVASSYHGFAVTHASGAVSCWVGGSLGENAPARVTSARSAVVSIATNQEAFAACAQGESNSGLSSWLQQLLRCSCCQQVR